MFHPEVLFVRVSLSIAIFLVLAACQGAPGAPLETDAASPPGTDAALHDGGPPPLDAGPAPIDAGEDASPPMGAACPPTGPFGAEVGDVAPDLVLMDCDGVAHTLHELCERRAVWLFEYADWCPPCRDFASGEANRIYDRFAGPELGAYMVISEDSGFGQPDAADCAAIRDRYGIHMPILYDPGTLFEDTFDVASNEVHVVLRQGAEMEWKGHYAGDEVESRIASALAP